MWPKNDNYRTLIMTCLVCINWGSEYLIQGNSINDRKMQFPYQVARLSMHSAKYLTWRYMDQCTSQTRGATIRVENVKEGLLDGSRRATVEVLSLTGCECETCMQNFIDGPYEGQLFYCSCVP